LCEKPNKHTFAALFNRVTAYKGHYCFNGQQLLYRLTCGYIKIIQKIIVMREVKKGDKIKIHYHGRLDDGTTFDSSEGREPLEFEVGGGMVIPGFDNGVLGMTPGQKKTINIPVDEAYGPVQDDMFMEFPINRFPEDMKPEVGMSLNMSNGSGQAIPVVIAEVQDEVVILDANHPLAGEDLTFDLELVEIVGGKPLIISPYD
jgi:peptidylprolyl isomerase